MQSMQHAHALERAGLSDKEAAVYLALLRLSSANAQTLSTQAKVKRGTVYTVLESLMKKGLVSASDKGGKQLFFPEDPEKLETLLSEKRAELERTEADVRDALGELRRLHHSGGTRPVVRYFEGDEGLRDLEKEISKSADADVHVFTDIDYLLRLFPGIYNQPQHMRVQKKGIADVLYTSKHGPIQGVNVPERYRNARWVSLPDGSGFAGDITIYHNKVSITSFRNPPVSILIEHEDITRLVREVFKTAWKYASEQEEPPSTISLEDIDSSK